MFNKGTCLLSCRRESYDDECKAGTFIILDLLRIKWIIIWRQFYRAANFDLNLYPICKIKYATKKGNHANMSLIYVHIHLDLSM